MRRKINKPILLSALALTQGIGTVMLVQNSIVQAYAEQKNKEVTSQEFLDYINQLKEQNPDFKFSQGETKVFESEEQALANLAEQKQAINTAIANYKQAVADRERAYEEAKANVKAQNEQIKQGNEQAEQEYQNQLNAYNAKKAEIAQWAQNNPVITQLDNGIELRGRYDESKKNSIHYFDNIAINASPEILSFGRYDTTSKPIKMSPNSTVEVVNASSSLIDNTNGYIGAQTLNNYPVKMVKSWRIKAGTPAGELLNMNLRNIGETDSGKTISAHVKFVLDYATNDSPVTNAEGSINVVKDGLLHMYWMPKSDNSADKQGGHYEIQFYDDDTGRPIKLANMLLSIDLDGETEKSTVSSENAKGVIPTLPSDVGTANETGTKYPTIESNTGSSVTYKGKTDFGVDDTKTTPYGEGLTLFAGRRLTVSFETNDSRWGGYSVINIPKLGRADLTLPEEPTHPTPTPLVDEPKLPPVVTPPQVGDIANTITYNRVAVRQVNTRWIDISGKELKTPVTDTTTKPAGDIDKYAFVESRTDDDGNVTHVFRQYTTKWVDDSGKELKDIVKGASPMPRGDEIKDYKFVESKTDEKGNVKHIFKQFTTRWVNTELEDLDDVVKTSEFKDAKTFENYQFVETREVGNTRTHIYRRYNTFWVEEKTNKELKKENKLVKEPGDIASYVYVRTETKENGDLVHIYKKVEQKKNDVPTGVHSNTLISLIATGLSVLGITILNKKKRGA